MRFESLIRLADRTSPRLNEQVAALAVNTRHRLAIAVLDSAIGIAADPRASLVERVVAGLAAHRVRSDVLGLEQLTRIQCDLVDGLETLGDLAAAYEVAVEALAECQLDHSHRHDTAQLSAAALRLARTLPAQRDDPLIEEAIASALAGGAAIGLEARIWAAIYLLDMQDHGASALQLADQITSELESHKGLGSVGNRWRLLLAFHAGQAGYLDITQRLLSPMLDTEKPEQWDAAHAVLVAVSGPRADIQLRDNRP